MIRKPFYIALWIALAAGLITAVALPIKALVYHSPDDAFFYLKTAQNFAAGLGSTFDGLNATNGYHPLWFLVLAAMFFLWEHAGVTSPDVLYRLSFALQWLLLLGSAHYSAQAMRSWVRSDSSQQWQGSASPYNSIGNARDITTHAMLLAVLVYFFVFIRVVGSEAQISVFVFATYWYIKTKEFESGVPRFLVKSALLALLFLARIDYVSTLVPALIIGDTVTTPRGYRLKNAFFQAAVAGATALCYFAINYIEFGHILTVSASWKSEFPRFLLFDNIPMYVRDNPVQFVRAAGAIVVCSIFAVHVMRRRNYTLAVDVFLAWAAVGAVLFMFQTMSFNAHKIREWYTSMPVFVAIIIAVRYSLRWQHIQSIIIAPLAALGLAFLLGAGMVTSKWDANYDFAHTLRQQLGKATPVMVVDCAGIVGYFSEAPVVNGDGLVNSFAYLDAVRSGELRSWLERRSVAFYATYTAVQQDSLNGSFIDRAVSGLGGMAFEFDSSQIVLRAPFSIDNIRFHSTGEWMVFRFDPTDNMGDRNGSP